MKKVLIVDGFSTGKHYAAAFKNLGYSCIHLHSSPSFNVLQDDLTPSDYDFMLVNNGDREEILHIAEQLRPSIVIPGCEYGVELADYLSEKLSLISNGSKLSLARRNKFVMQEQVARMGLRSVRQFKTADISAAKAWLHEQEINEFIIKPLKSAGTNLFHFGNDDTTLTLAFHNVLNHPDVFGDVNSEVLIQERIVGQEYAVNTVSYQGEHYISDICKYKKTFTEDKGNVYDSITLEPFNIPEFNMIKDYVFAVLNALGINYGPAHTEIFLTEQGPVLVETGARLMGASVPAFFRKCMGHSQFDLTITAYTEPKEFKHQIKKPYTELNAHGMYVFLINTQERIMKQLNQMALNQLGSYYGIHLYARAGELLLKTRDLMSSPGVVYLCHADKKILANDYQALRQAEKNNLIY